MSPLNARPYRKLKGKVTRIIVETDAGETFTLMTPREFFIEVAEQIDYGPLQDLYRNTDLVEPPLSTLPLRQTFRLTAERCEGASLVTRGVVMKPPVKIYPRFSDLNRFIRKRGEE